MYVTYLVCGALHGRAVADDAQRSECEECGAGNNLLLVGVTY